jgi:hypothetical protein
VVLECLAHFVEEFRWWLRKVARPAGVRGRLRGRMRQVIVPAFA